MPTRAPKSVDLPVLGLPIRATVERRRLPWRRAIALRSIPRRERHHLDPAARRRGGRPCCRPCGGCRDCRGGTSRSASRRGGRTPPAGGRGRPRPRMRLMRAAWPAGNWPSGISRADHEPAPGLRISLSIIYSSIPPCPPRRKGEIDNRRSRRTGCCNLVPPPFFTDRQEV